MIGGQERFVSGLSPSLQYDKTKGTVAVLCFDHRER
jgi:hypothetical protein